MITAKEMYLKTNAAAEHKRERTLEQVEIELQYLENRMMEAAHKGEYECEYWWSNNCIKEWDIIRTTFIYTICAALIDAGYINVQVLYDIEEENDTIYCYPPLETGLKICWGWEVGKDNE